jgi:uncharacterized membrane protein YdjX (TVP38/TMEM64 family)
MKRIKSYKNTIYLFLGVIFTLILYALFYNSPYYAGVLDWSQNHIVLFVILLIAFKVIGIVYPPIPGGTFIIGTIPFLGWFPTYLLDLAGSIIGACIAYFLGSRYGYSVLHRLFDDSVVHKISSVRIKKGKEIEAIFVYRLLLGGTILEGIYYGAGLMHVKFRNFLIGSILSHAVVGIPLFYLVKNAFSIESALIIAIPLLIVFLVFTKLKHRYFEDNIEPILEKLEEA